MLALLDSPHAGLQSAAADCLSEVRSAKDVDGSYMKNNHISKYN